MLSPTPSERSRAILGVPADYRIKFLLVGEAGKLPAVVATPLAVVLTELLQNVVEHAYPMTGDGPREGEVEVRLDNDGEHLTVTVTDDGAGLPGGFSMEDSSGLGLSIVRTLVTSEMQGTIEMRSGDPMGSVARVVVPVTVPEL